MDKTDFAGNKVPNNTGLGSSRSRRTVPAQLPAGPAGSRLARTDQRERCIVFDALDEAERLLRGDGRDAALELVRAARLAWKARCNDIEGEPVDIFDRFRRGRYLGSRRFARRTMPQGCKLLSRICPDLLVDIGGGRYCFPFTDFKSPSSQRLEHLEGWRLARRAERRAIDAGDRCEDPELGPVRSGPKGNARAAPYPRYQDDLEFTESAGGGAVDGSLASRTAAARRDLRRLGPAIEGEGGDNKTFIACSIPADWDLPIGVADALLDRWNEQCQPPWTARELAKKKASAARNRKQPVGYKATGANHLHDPRCGSNMPRARLTASMERWWNAAPTLDTLEAHGPVQWLKDRGIDPAKVRDLDLARVLPGFGNKLPRWAMVGGRTWADAGIRLILPVYNAKGGFGGVRGRWTGPIGPTAGQEGANMGQEGSPQVKEAAPYKHRSVGLVFANDAARAMLRGESLSDVLTVVEGAPDYLTLATRTDDPVIGVFAGSWTAELAGRVPDGAEVVLATHPDRSGDAYARQISATLGRCDLQRLLLPPGQDLNDVCRDGEPATLTLAPIESNMTSEHSSSGRAKWSRP